MDLAIVLSVILDIFLLPLQVILIPIDALLAQIGGIGVIPSYINSLFTLIGTFPSTIVALTGIAPILWNTAIGTFLLFFTLSPSISIVKKIWAYIRW